MPVDQPFSRENPRSTRVTRLAKARGLVAVGAALAAGGIPLGETDDAPGAALLGLLMLVGSVALAVRLARRKP